MRVVKPRRDRNGVIGMEDVRCWRVVDDDGLLELAPDLRQILDVVALVVVAAFSEQAVVHDLVDVQLVQQRIAVLRNGVSLHGNT